MFPDQVSHTSLLTAAARAAESARKGGLFADPHAAALAGRGGESLLAEVGPDTAVPSIAIRTRYFDDAVRASVARGVRQVVLLGAGLDTRAYRLDLPRDVRWFEVDRGPVLDHKRAVLAAALPTVHREEVPGDACAEEAFTELLALGLAPDAPALWVAEGLLCFLSPDEVRALFANIRRSSRDAEVLFDVPSLACVQARGDFARAGGALHKRGLQFGTDDPESLARTLGLTATVVHEGHPRAHFGRRNTPPSTHVPPGTWTVYYVHGHFET